MADETFISQDVNLVGADAATVQISQDANLVGADSATAQISQFNAAVGADSATAQISQFVLLVSTGPLVPPPAAVRAFTFDAGSRSHYWLALAPTDSGDELRSKVVKAGRVTGKVTKAGFQIYKWDVGEPIDVAKVEAGTDAATRLQELPDVPQVTQSARKQVNVPNAVLSSLRVRGTWEGDEIKDRLDEIVYEHARQGARR